MQMGKEVWQRESDNNSNDLTIFFFFRNSSHKIAANVKLVHILTSNRAKIKHVKINYCYKYVHCARGDNSCLTDSSSM